MSSSVTDISGARNGLRSPKRFLNRELSWLDFNLRVLETAANERVPLLERVRFLSISASNLDEFYMVRVAGLVGQVMAGVADRSADGLTPARQLDAIRDKARSLLDRQYACERKLLSLCRDAGISIASPGSLGRAERKWLSSWFETQLFPVLSPQAVDPARPFPFIRNGSLVYAVQLSRGEDGKRMKGLILVPPQVERFIRIPGPETLFVPLEKVMDHHMDSLFPGFDVEARGIFQITRDSLLEIDEEADDLVGTFETALKRRKGGYVIRVDVDADMPEELAGFIMNELRTDHAHFFRIEGMLGLASISQIILGERGDLLYRRMNARYPERVREFGGDVIAAVRQKDFVVHHPYESFDVVVEFLKQAARDPAVVAIKQTLYRTSDDSPIVKQLIEAAEAGKSVTALVELKARFDEEANIRWARDLENAGAQVVYGFMDLKTHAKVSLVVRREGEGIRTYAHFGTGNYHPVTAKLYADLSYFTADEALGRDAAKLFNYMTGYATPEKMEKLLYSPVTLGARILELIEEEMEHARAGRPAVIWAKMNSLVDGRGDRRPLRRQPRGGRDRAFRSGHMLPSSRGPRAFGEHKGQEHGGALSRARKDSVFRGGGGTSLRRVPGVRLVGGLDAEEPSPKGGGHGSDRERHGKEAACGAGDGRQHEGRGAELGDASRRIVPEARGRRRRFLRPRVLHDQSQSFRKGQGACGIAARHAGRACAGINYD